MFGFTRLNCSILKYPGSRPFGLSNLTGCPSAAKRRDARISLLSCDTAFIWNATRLKRHVRHAHRARWSIMRATKHFHFLAPFQKILSWPCSQRYSGWCCRCIVVGKQDAFNFLATCWARSASSIYSVRAFNTCVPMPAGCKDGVVANFHAHRALSTHTK